MSVVLSEHLPLLATAPNGIQKLRGLILDLAVRGKLVPQDHSDEPARELLKRIANERATLAADGTYKKFKATPTICEDERQFVIPQSWSWVRLSSVANKITDGTHHSPPNLPSGDFKYISARNIKSWGIDQSGMTYVTKAVHEEIFARCNPEPGDVLYIKDGATTGVVAINTLTEPFSMLSSVALLKPSIGLFNRYLYFLMSSPVFYSEMRAGMTGVAITRVTLAKLNSALLPLPPLAEQHRIVAKVDELMALCDRLEAEQSNSTSAHARLVETLLGALTQSSDAADLADNWQRLAEHFDTLFTTESSLEALKQTILQLAVMGKLVPQDQNDEPASELLKRIADEKARLISEGVGRKMKPLAVIGEEGSAVKLHSLPLGWTWTSFGQATICRDGERIPISQDERNLREKLYDYYGASGVIDRIDGFLFDKPLLLIGEDGANLINRSTPIAFIARGEYWVNNHAHVIDGITEAFLRFIELYINATDLKPYVTGTAQPKMNQAKMNGIPISMPPEAEQNRIVAKVDELMALCDRLKADLATARQHQATLADTLIESALEAA